MSSTELTLLVALAVLLVAGLAALVYFRQRRTAKLRDRFGGAEYDLAITDSGGRRKAEAELDKRSDRIAHFQIKPLEPADRARFEDSWRAIQVHFVDGPAGAVAEADRLLSDVMSTRGYPVGDFEQRAADISLDHPDVLAHYRTAHEIALRQGKGRATTEELRQAMIHYRTLFEDLVVAPSGA
ncbi:MAG TPA: hypothetical protein VLA75_00625 [Thermoanaerobaculia bacterium]|nr:hypothetical protein [Thermoanaerobaculia bacterium]